MAVLIQIDQPGSGAPPGVAGFSREDLMTGFNVQLTATGGPFAAYLWSIIDKPIDIVTPVMSAAVLTAPGAAVTLVAPVDLVGPYLVEVLVDSGSGLGALADDVDRRTFYAGPVLNSLNPDPRELPRREIAFRERGEHNVPDAIFPAGNSRGWAQEWLRWRAVYDRVYRGKSWAWGRVVLPGGGPAALVSGLNTLAVVRTAVGTVAVTFATPLPNANYAVTATARGPVGGSCTADLEAVGGFTLSRSNPGGALIDADFTFHVQLQV